MLHDFPRDLNNIGKLAFSKSCGGTSLSRSYSRESACRHTLDCPVILAKRGVILL